MPNRDGTGPQGQGAQTGRALGNCQKQENVNTQRPYGRGMGCGRGMKHGQRRGRCENRRR